METSFNWIRLSDLSIKTGGLQNIIFGVDFQPSKPHRIDLISALRVFEDLLHRLWDLDAVDIQIFHGWVISLE